MKQVSKSLMKEALITWVLETCNAAGIQKDSKSQLKLLYTFATETSGILSYFNVNECFLSWSW
jgi:hypothetical protein